MNTFDTFFIPPPPTPHLTLQGASDYPRSINIFVAGDRADASYAGYGWVPSSPSDIVTGHVSLLWSVLDVAQWNGRPGWEYGSKVLWHEIMHHLGLYHTFGRGNKGQGCTAGADDGVPDTPIVAGPVYNQAAFAQQSRAYCLSYFDTQLGGSWDAAVQAWRTRLGVPPADANHGFDSCPSLPGNDELGNYITYTHDVCIPALGHMTPGQVAYLHNMTERYQSLLYRWGQYFATLAPEAFQISHPPPPSPPAPSPPPALAPGARAPPPSQPPLSACQKTRSGCRCRSSWSFRGQRLAGCANPDGDEAGLWCPVEQDGNCASAINGYWDYCAAGLQESNCAAEFPRPPSPPPATPRPPSTPCGPGAVTQSGSFCASEAWALLRPDGTFNETHVGCANPDNDPQGPWCRLQPGFTSLLGRTWDYCGPACAPSPSPAPPAAASQPPPATAPPPAANATNATNATVPGGAGNATEKSKAGSGSGSGSLTLESLSGACVATQGLPSGCACRDAWGVVLKPSATAVSGRRYHTARHCTALPELQPAASPPPAALADGAAAAAGGAGGSSLVGVCEVSGCNDGSLNGRVMVCASPCTQLGLEDGQDVQL
ncbi:hypothetical protein GPECTOR_3g119 [Gonium pectorale]|uniref:Peptidase M43 pregnancy-associated plasma-A domain-containing protein n=1 Tax=Gonium pectorale TaxID=33097 RepID=A0A150H051_GONPE|nr:hypothetical protein GPECTOR_3g119 [Gonium pectorale]|eukprot:KXZ54950.1 hypothetical protein GPECTOR_3g119 [Gonium pectorale]